VILTDFAAMTEWTESLDKKGQMPPGIPLKASSNKLLMKP